MWRAEGRVDLGVLRGADAGVLEGGGAHALANRVSEASERVEGGENLGASAVIHGRMADAEAVGAGMLGPAGEKRFPVFEIRGHSHITNRIHKNLPDGRADLRSGGFSL